MNLISKLRKLLTIHLFMLEYSGKKATRYEKEAAQDTMSEEGTVRAFGGIRCGPLSCGLRDQDGCSRYRAAKIQGISL